MPRHTQEREMTKEVIDTKIEALNKRVKDIENRPTEVYSRIVGYYRSVKNWNNGKSAEYKIRKTFMEPEMQACQPPILNPVKNEEVRAENITEEAAAVAVAVEESNNQADLFTLQGDDEKEKKDENTGSYLFFFRTTCPNCPPMKEFLESQEWEGSHINVDEEEGLNAAVENNVFTAPTVILLSSQGTEIFRADSAAALKEYVEAGEKAFSAV
jgi:glutaredoxin